MTTQTQWSVSNVENAKYFGTLGEDSYCGPWLKAATEKADKIVRDAEKRAENTRRMLARDIQNALDSIV